HRNWLRRNKQRGAYRNISRIGGCHHDRGRTQRNQLQQEQEEPEEKKAQIAPAGSPVSAYDIDPGRLGRLGGDSPPGIPGGRPAGNGGGAGDLPGGSGSRRGGGDLPRRSGSRWGGGDLLRGSEFGRGDR